MIDPIIYLAPMTRHLTRIKTENKNSRIFNNNNNYFSFIFKFLFSTYISQNNEH